MNTNMKDSKIWALCSHIRLLRLHLIDGVKNISNEQWTEQGKMLFSVQDKYNTKESYRLFD